MADVSPATLYSTLFPKRADPRSLYNAMQDEWEVGQILPIQRNRLTGDYDMAVPQMATEAMRAFQAPGKALQGGYGLAADSSGRVSYDGMAEDAAGLAGMVTLGAGAVPRPAGALDMGFRVFHGSPHDFDKFDMSKMGTGEGSQAYGRGLYFAENEGVAKSYQKGLAGVDVFHGKEPYNGAISVVENRVDPKSYALSTVQNYGGVDEALDALRKSAGSDTPAERKRRYEDATGWLEENRADVHVRENGKIYEAEIDADTDDFFDWDKPLSEQPPKVQEALEASGLLDETTRTMTGGDFYRDLAAHLRDLAIIRGDNGATTLNASDDAAATMLRGAGVPGLRYLDQGSRNKGDGSRNYVVFDDSLIDIKAKK